VSLFRLLLLACLAAAHPCAAAAADRRPLRPADLWALQRLGSPALSPDGRQVVFTVQEWSVERNQATTQLWLTEVANGATRRLTTARAADGSPAWSPDGTRIAFTSKRGEDESPALYLLRLDGGEPERVLDLPYGVSSPRWLPDGSGLVVVTRVIPELAGKLQAADLAALRQEQRRRKDSKISAKVTEHASTSRRRP
jgi:Tol biopolymer transport system component